jgi:hypothetical protein
VHESGHARKVLLLRQNEDGPVGESIFNMRGFGLFKSLSKTNIRPKWKEETHPPAWSPKFLPVSLTPRPNNW